MGSTPVSALVASGYQSPSTGLGPTIYKASAISRIPPHCTGMVAMTGKALYYKGGSGSGNGTTQRNALTSRAEGNASTIGFRPYRDVNWDADLNTAASENECCVAGGAPFRIVGP